MPDSRLSTPTQARRTIDPALAGTVQALTAFVVWGLSPIYFKALRDVPAPEILAHRILWSLLLMGALVLALRSRAAIGAIFADPRRLRVLGLTTVLVSGNWLLYIWAVNDGRILEASLGYYINPLANVVLGVLFLRE